MGRKSTSVSISKKRLTDILEEHDLMNYAELGRILGYARETITRSINNECMDIHLLDAICRLVNVSPRFITGDTDERAPYTAGHSIGAGMNDKTIEELQRKVESLERKVDAMHKAMDMAGTAFDMIARTFTSQQDAVEQIMKDILAVEIRTDMLARKAGMEFDEDTVEKIHEEAERTFEESMAEAREMFEQADDEEDTDGDGPELDAGTQVIRLDPVKIRELKKILGIDADGDDDTDDSDDMMWKLTERMMN